MKLITHHEKLTVKQRYINRNLLYKKVEAGTEVVGYTAETASTAGIIQEGTFEESRVNLAKKHTHKLVLQVCRKQVHRKEKVLWQPKQKTPFHAQSSAYSMQSTV